MRAIPTGIGIGLVVLPVLAAAQDPVPSEEGLEGAFPAQEHYSPYAGRHFPTNVYWGDTHLHTGMSMDAGAFGARLMPDDAYRFAKGEDVTSSTGQRVKLSRPLDWLVVADHSDNMGFFPRLYAGEPSMLADPTGRRWYDGVQAGGQDAVAVAAEVIQAFSQNSFPEALASLPGSAAYRDAWELTIDAAEANNDPGEFTAFIGYEWTSTESGINLHRVVVYRDDADKANVMEPAFLVAALKDPLSGNLDPSQVVKGWLDDRGRRQEKVYDVAWSGDRSPGADGKLPPVGNTVDVANATWTNTIGAPELITVWTDPNFDPEQPAVYYARVLEIPTPRWTACEAVRFGVEMPNEDVPMTTQERAYTSPIWYTP